jgi:hypothetical protein
MKNITYYGIWFGFWLDLVGLNVWLLGAFGQKINNGRCPLFQKFYPIPG